MQNSAKYIKCEEATINICGIGQGPGKQWLLPTSMFQEVLVDMLLGQTEEREEEDRGDSERRSM